MDYNNRLYKFLDIEPSDISSVKAYCRVTEIHYQDLKYYNNNNILPSGHDLQKILKSSGKSVMELKLAMGIIDQGLKNLLSEQYLQVASLLNEHEKENRHPLAHQLAFTTEYGKMYQGDCLSLLKEIEDESVDLIFADPPFNLDKFYLSDVDDDLREVEYLEWSEMWIKECVRILKKGGSFFLWNLPKWNTYLSAKLNDYLTFRHWIATDIKFSLPIRGRLYPSHYSLLYYTKGEKPDTFHPDRMAMEVCPKCYNDLKDYGGYKNKMNPQGVNMTDVWFDIPPVRHKKYKNRKEANELSIKLLDRIIEMASDPGDLVFDPFGGAGTTYAVAEIKKRHWIGIELGPVDQIAERLADTTKEAKLIAKYRANYNDLFPEKIERERKKRGYWTTDSFPINGKQEVKKEKKVAQGNLFK